MPPQNRMPPPPPTLSRAGSNELLERRSSQNKAVQDRFKQFISKEYVISDQNGADTQPYNNITISDDHSEGSAIKKRKLIAAASEKGEMSMTRNRNFPFTDSHDDDIFASSNPRETTTIPIVEGDQQEQQILQRNQQQLRLQQQQQQHMRLRLQQQQQQQLLLTSKQQRQWQQTYAIEQAKQFQVNQSQQAQASKSQQNEGRAQRLPDGDHVVDHQQNVSPQPYDQLLQHPLSYNPNFTMSSYDDTFGSGFKPSKMSHGSPSLSGPKVAEKSQSDIENTGEITDISDELSRLRAHVADLESKLQGSSSANPRSDPFRYQVLYCLQSYDDRSSDESFFEDEPEISYSQQGEAHLRCRMPVKNLETHIMKNQDISFVVYRQYPRKLPPQSTKRRHLPDSSQSNHLPSPASEKIYPVHENLKGVLKTLLGRKPEFKEDLEIYQDSEELAAPYLFIYHSRDDMKNMRAMLSPKARDQLDLFLQYVDYAFGDEYRLADDLLSKGQILPECVKYLVKPGDILVRKTQDEYTGFITGSWLLERPNRKAPMSTFNRGPLEVKPAIFDLGHNTGPPQHRTKYSWTFFGETLQFDGTFFWKSERLAIEILREPQVSSLQINPSLLTSNLHDVKSITELDVFPLRFAPEAIIKRLERRASTYLKCRTKGLVCYQPDDSDRFREVSDDRYMIDMRTFRTLHPNNAGLRGTVDNDLGLDVMDNDDRFKYLMPPIIKGYNLRQKAWHDLAVDRIFDVKWNREAFHSLVIEPKAKSLIEALVVSQLESEKSTDLISGKGNGLILLFHGGPGTGKTLTAEGVAEIAKKPLYRVTCGDVGTKAEDVEKYLKSVLHLGRIWDCVVLLDEADVFLEQRSLEDLQRNALVSVFLRVLEYYEGILILTSNRVGTFDEAFISRIQLALHYPELKTHQRLKIWELFIDRLDELFGDRTEEMEEKIDVVNLRENLGLLKHEELNGRQIRNVITTARQYAKWQNKELTYEHLKDVIEISGRFGTYLHKLKGYSADELAKDGGVR